MSKIVNVRLDEQMVREVDAVRDPSRFPTQSDFVREAIRRMIREERRNRVRAEVRELARDQEEMARVRAMANVRLEDAAEHLARSDRGEE